MAATSHNHANYQVRLDFVQNLLLEQFGIKEDAETTPIQYDPECPFKYNNFVYRISLRVPITLKGTVTDEPQQPGCAPVPNGTKELIFRLTNPDAEGMDRTTRVENEVAIIALASAALVDFVPHVVPAVYAWGSAAVEYSQGWIIQEMMPGSPVDESLDAMNLEQKRQIFAQMAKMLKALQDYKLPESIASFGGVTFDDAGRTISTAMASVGAGPWPSYEASFKGQFEVALREADSNAYIKGWRANGVRERLDAFIERGIPAQFEALGSKEDRVIIHADFTASNLLFNAASGRITALIDHDFAFVSHPSYEFLRSFGSTGGRFRGWSSDEATEDMALREAQLHGFPSPLPPSTKDGVKWDVVKAWEDELEKVGVKRPRNILGIDKVADVDTVLRTILPWRVSNPDVLKLQSKEVTVKCRNENEAQLVGLLSRLGF